MDIYKEIMRHQCIYLMHVQCTYQMRGCAYILNAKSKRKKIQKFKFEKFGINH